MYKIKIKGIVQGVGFRPFIYRVANQLNLKGYVKNTPEGVEIVIDKKINNFLSYIKKNHPPLARIERIDVKDVDFRKLKKFKIVKSSKGRVKTISIPPDISICEECLEEMSDRRNRRYGYWFITCTNCGPRFTITKKMPYDRATTTMGIFEMCKMCRKEYNNPSDRRYHAQTVACTNCGPRLRLFDNKKREIGANNIILKTCELLKRKNIVAIKGIGGIHLTCLTTDDKLIKRLRKKRRPTDKPFAVMARDINMIKSFAEINKFEERVLKSFQRPIVLLKKSKDYWLSKEISPGLHNIGVMLPYSPIHYLIFQYINEPLIMTSANLPDEPTIKDEDKAFRKLSEIADFFLIHNRQIYFRCDDSVIKIINRKSVFIRRSRGYSQQIQLNISLNKNILALGSELNNTFSIYNNGVYISQYIGDISNLDTFFDLVKNLEKFKRLINVKKFDVIICDLHPAFNITKLGEELSKRNNCNLLKVQHHFAHLASCMAEYDLENATGIVCDGYGFGLDKNAWGGEVIVANKDRFERIGHLEYQPLIGGDMATIYPSRIVVGILSKFMEKNEIKKLIKDRVSEKDIEIWLKQLEQDFNIVYSSSCGRFLDAVSFLLNVCNKRTYEGEPAMKLESLALNGKRIIDFPIKIEKRGDKYILNTTIMFQTLVENLKKDPADLALSIHHALALGLSKIAKKTGKNICFSGGVAYNELFNRFLKENISNILTQTKVPCGDGGISLGQLYYFHLKNK